MHHRRQGDVGEAAALAWYASRGAQVFVPVGHAPDYDLVVDVGDGPRRVQVKTTTQRRGDRWVVSLRTSGGNRSWSGVVRRFSSERCDELFVVCGDGRQWRVPSAAVAGGAELTLGGPRYSAYEVAPGWPLAPTEDARRPRNDGSPA